MPDFYRKLLGLLLILATVGVASWQTLSVSCSSANPAGGTVRGPHAAPTPR